MDIQIISDTMCPWCWVGKRHLEAAIQQMSQEDNDSRMDANIEWLPYFLDKDLPETGKPIHEYYRDNNGNPHAGDEMKPHLIAAGHKQGIDFETTHAKLTHYRPTIRSHRLIEYVKKQDPSKQNDIVEALFDLYYIQGKHLNSIDHLCEAAESIGLNATTIRTYLESSLGEDEVYQTAQSVQSLAQGVPTFIIRPRQGGDAATTTTTTTKKAPLPQVVLSGARAPVAFKRAFYMLQHQLEQQQQQQQEQS